jgi:hypothetical protein
MPTVLPVFPNTNSIPPVTFYNMMGLASWLNKNPSYKQYYVNYPVQFPYLYKMNSTLSSLNYVIEKVPLACAVTTLSQSEAMKYTKQLQLFQNVYQFNSNAYVNSITNGINPIYYSFKSYKDMTEYKSSVALVNKLYPFKAMANATNQDGATISWIIPFPL